MKTLVTPENQARKYAKLSAGTATLMLFVASDDTKASWADTGRSFERVALRATALGIRHTHLNMPCEVPEVRRALRRHLGLDREEPLLLLRAGYAPSMPRSLRRPVEDVLLV